MNTWTLLASLATGAVGGGIVAIVGSALQGKRDHQRWVREQRYEALFSFLELVDKARFMSSLGREHDSSDEEMARMQSISSRVVFLGPEGLRDSVDKLRSALTESLDGEDGATDRLVEAREVFMDRARAVLKIPRR